MKVTEEDIARASAETECLQRELDITNADHIALWLEANKDDSTLGWLSCRIIDAHEQEVALAQRRALERAAEAMENLCFYTPIDDLLGMTKQEMSVRTCAEGAKAIRALGDG